MFVIQGQRTEHGFSLIELMIAMALSLILMLGVYTLFDIQQYGFQIVTSLNDREDNAQIALTLLADDISMADHWGGVDKSRIHLIQGTLKAPGGCQYQWVYDHENSVQGLEGQPSVTGVKPLPAGCLNGNDYRSNTDMLALRFGDSRQVISDSLVDNKRYTNHYFFSAQAGEVAVLFQGKNSQEAQKQLSDQGLHQTMVFNSYLYFLKPCSITSASCSESMNVLTRLTLKGNRYMQEGLVENIEDMQFEYGVDEDEDGVVERYVSADEVDRWQYVLSVRIFLLVRNRLMDKSIDELGKEYVMSSDDALSGNVYTVPESGRYFPRVRYVKDVSIRNRLVGG